MPVSKTRKRPRTATHRPATRQRLSRHDDLTAVDMFSGFGGLTEGIRQAGFTTIMAANHNAYKTGIHEDNHPYAEHWIADLVDPESADYHSARDLPAADLLAAGVSCRNHSGASSKKAYARAISLFDVYDPEYEERVTRSERDRATANCVLHYAQQHHPLLILVECTTELQSWGPGLPDRPTVGDGTTFRWWRKELRKLRYKQKLLYLNSMFFGVGQSRDRLFIVMWDERLPDPDLEHRPESWCARCDRIVEAQWTWRTGVPPTGTVRYGQQYDYRCPSCRSQVFPPATPSLDALDLTDLGTRIGDRPYRTHQDGSFGPLAAGTMGRAARCLQRLPDFPPITLPTGTAHEDAAVLAVNNYQGTPRGPDEPLPTQAGSETLSLVSTGVMPLRKSAMPRSADEPMPAVTAAETISLVSAGVLPFRKHTIPATHAEAMAAMTADQIPGLVTTTGLVEVGADTIAQWAAWLATLTVEDLRFRMLFPHEVGRACGFDTTFPGRPGTFKVWGTAKQQVDGYGNAVTPGVGLFLGLRLRRSLHGAGGTVPRPRQPIF